MRNALFLASLLGMTLMLFFARSIEPRTVESVDGETGFVQFLGWVASVKEYNGHFFVTACAEKCATLSIFRAQAERMQERTLDPASLRNGQRVSFIGLAEGSRIKCLNEYCVEVLS